MIDWINLGQSIRENTWVLILLCIVIILVLSMDQKKEVTVKENTQNIELRKFHVPEEGLVCYTEGTYGITCLRTTTTIIQPET